MGTLFLGLLIGLAVTAVVYWELKTRLDRQQQEVQQLRKKLEDQERAYESRLRQTVQSLQTDYQQQLEQKLEAKTEQTTEAIQQQYEARLQQLETARELAIQAIPTPTEAPSEVPSEVPSDLAEAALTPPPALAEIPAQSIAPTVLQDAVSTSSIQGVMATNAAVPAQPKVLESIAPWGRIGGVGSLPVLLSYAGHANSEIRQQVALELGQVIATYGNRAEIQRCIPTLARLSQDANASVRRAAVQSLGSVPSVKVLPYLKRALRDSNLEVVRTASTAIARFKLYGNPAEENPASRNKKMTLPQQPPTRS